MEARFWLAVRGYDPMYGARPLRRLIQQAIGMRALGRAVRTGALTPAAYEAYQSGDAPLESFLNLKAIQ